MDFFIRDAFAQGTPANLRGPGISDFVFLVVLFGVFWFLLIRPQQKRAKDHKKMVEALAKGDEVVTNGGLLGRITKLGDSFITIEVSQGNEVHVQRGAVSALMPKGTMKSL